MGLPNQDPWNLVKSSALERRIKKLEVKKNEEASALDKLLNFSLKCFSLVPDPVLCNMSH